MPPIGGNNFFFSEIIDEKCGKKEDINAGYVKDSIKNGFVIFLNTLKCVPPLMALHVFDWNYWQKKEVRWNKWK